jgi:hypothetical protein
MSFSVRVYGYSGLAQMHVSHMRQYNSQSVFLAEEPPVWSQVAVSNGATPVAIVANLLPGVTDTARVLGIEVPDGQQIRYELQILGPLASNARTPGNLSRRMSGFDFIAWSPGATFSFCDAANFL